MLIMVNDVKVRLAIIESKALGVELRIAKLEMRGHLKRRHGGLPPLPSPPTASTSRCNPML
ncbi:unnamed protein product [Musa acuminata subsp. burmannicoides]